jgi:hypothetical protein
MEITLNELLNVLNTINKPTFIHIVMETPVRMNKTGNPFFGQVIKRTSGNYLIGTDYEQRVNNNSEKEGLDRSFVVEPPKGKRHISKCVLIDTKTESVHYLMMERFDEIHPSVEYHLVNGDPIEKTLFESYMVKVYESTKQEQERKVTPITPKLSNIRQFSIDGMKYEIPVEVGVEVGE